MRRDVSKNRYNIHHSANDALLDVALERYHADGSPIELARRAEVREISSTHCTDRSRAM